MKTYQNISNFFFLLKQYYPVYTQTFVIIILFVFHLIIRKIKKIKKFRTYFIPWMWMWNIVVVKVWTIQDQWRIYEKEMEFIWRYIGGTLELKKKSYVIELRTFIIEQLLLTKDKKNLSHGIRNQIVDVFYNNYING